MTATLEDVQRALDKEITIIIETNDTTNKSKKLSYSPLSTLYTIIQRDWKTMSRKVRHFRRVETALKHYNNINLEI